MFTIGTSERLELPRHQLVRHSIVWIGESSGETSRGLPASHPISVVILRVLTYFKFLGTWLMCRNVALLREFDRKATLRRLSRARWVVDPDDSAVIRAHRVASQDFPWPYADDTHAVALPWPQAEILIVGGSIDYSSIDCRDNTIAGTRSIRGEGIVLYSDIVHRLVAQECHAVCVGRTQTDNSPGISIIGRPGLKPEDFVSGESIFAVHRDQDAGRAWSYGRIIRSSP